ncbi:uncharacterized protein EDB93DRAFT_1257825 [Suillus bovinus]|uniref:uncharacterized protein n=1 Tax=Suillus bovinus TaxID=48563 RepID=UPI001B88356F|nr:uncharacterized protein EDB93DRAFT_1257825 [Suillus bovinus]KAG2126001.1 hypothetical protein EDB93DRAFT_1257825 [Suillus bovinus]
MTPLPVHEQPAAHLAKAINNFTEAIPYHRLLINITMHLNHCIQNKDSTNIPDIHLIVTVQPPDNPGSNKMEIAKLILKWVGESGLSSDTDCMVRKLSITCDGHPDVSYAFIISFKERTRWQQPKEGSVAYQLRSASPLDYEEFIPARIKKSLKFGPVEITSHTWIDISEVHYSVFKHGTDSCFDFNNKDAATFAEGTLHSILQMGDIECMLDDTTGSLKAYIVLLMEGMGIEQAAIQAARDSHPVFRPVWMAALNSISSVISLTAYCHYLDWRNHKYDKCKMTHVTIQSSGSTSMQPTTVSISSILTTSSSDATTTSSAELSLDVQEERSAKKSKVQPDSEDRPEGSTIAKVKTKKKLDGGGKGKRKGKGCK